MDHAISRCWPAMTRDSAGSAFEGRVATIFVPVPFDSTTSSPPRCRKRSDSPDSDSGALGLNLGQLFWRHSATLILNLHNDLIGLASNTDGCALTSSAMHVALSQRR